MTESLSLRQRATLVEALSSSLEHGGVALGTVPKAVARVLSEGAWREFVTSRGEHVTHERFADFVTMPPLKGLGSDIALVRRIVSDDIDALDLLDQALQNPAHTHADVDNINISRPHGTSQSQALRRLRKNAPQLHADVLAGRLSAHGAMVRAGFRPKTVSVPVTKPEAVARSLLKYMSADDIAKLVAVLVGAADLSAHQGDGTV
jgi:hypothetical protein